MASHAALYGTPGAPARFAQMLAFALASPEIAEPAQQLGIEEAQLAAIVSSERAEALATTAHHAWARARQQLRRAERAHATATARHRSHRLRRRLRKAHRPQHVWRERVERLDAELAELRRSEESLRQAYVDTCYEQGILPTLRAFLDERGDRTWSTTLALSERDAPGLAELRSGPWVPLTAIERVDDLMRRMPGGSIGISGPRGVGKTTLIRWFTGAVAGPPIFGVHVSAPTRYDAREFLLHVFATLCSVVIGEHGPEERRRQPGEGSVRLLRNWLARPFVSTTAILVPSIGLMLASILHAQVDVRLLAGLACLGVAAAATLAVRSPSAFRGSPRWWRQRLASRTLASLAAFAGGGLIVLSQRSASTPLWAWGAFGVALAVALPFWLAGIGPEDPDGWDSFDGGYDGDVVTELLRQRARRELEGIRFQMTLSSGWSGTAKLPFVEGGLTGERSLASRPMSLPEVTVAIEDFIRAASAVRPVVIGIDELDKISSEEAAHQFLNEIKGVFGIPDCFFLVSVSEEAMSSFARRDARLRDAFDSSFDEIVHLRALTLDQSRAVLSQRVIGLPVQFAALCHVLAGGLPRDLIRFARLVVSLNSGTASLAQVVRDLLVIELEVRARATAIKIRGMSVHAAALPVLAWLAEVERAVDVLDAACAEDDMLRSLDPESHEHAQLMELVLELEGFCYFAMTLRETFDDLLDRERFEAMQAGYEAGSIEALARARGTFSINALLAWQEVSAFRRANGLRPIGPPRLRGVDAESRQRVSRDGAG